ncbi:MAG: hypothetical protein HFE75_04710 [Firmicutes bacterium]|jgi:hypothetical protein|nr:hypothetical protein [Bacillota bacterium]
MDKIKKRHRLWTLRVCLLIVAALFIVLGVLRQEHWDVFQKAVKLCLECVGIG